MESQISMDDLETKAWLEMGRQTTDKMLNAMHDHGWVEQEDGSYMPLPNGSVGERCRTCGDLIEE